MIQWVRHRRGGRTHIEQERPSPSYIIDVSLYAVVWGFVESDRT